MPDSAGSHELEQARVVVGPEEPLAALEDVVVVLVPAEALAAAEALLDLRDRVERSERQLERAGEVGDAVRIGQRERLLGGSG